MTPESLTHHPVPRPGASSALQASWALWAPSFPRAGCKVTENGFLFRENTDVKHFFKKSSLFFIFYFIFYFILLYFIFKQTCYVSKHLTIIISWSERRSCQSCPGSALAAFMGNNSQDIFLGVLVRTSESGECIVQRDAILCKTFIWVLCKPLCWKQSAPLTSCRCLLPSLIRALLPCLNIFLLS